MAALQRFFSSVLDVQGAVVVGGRFNKKHAAVEIVVRRHGNARPRCAKHRRTVLTGKISRHRTRWRHLDILRCRTDIVADRHEGYCQRCRGRRRESVPWAADTRARHTIAFDRAVASLVQVADREAASRMFDVAWRTVGTCVRRVVAMHLPKDMLADLTAIGVDETSYKRGHRYITVVTNLFTGRVVWIGEGKSSKTLASFFAELGPERAARLQFVTMDMSGAFLKAIQDNVPRADIAFDRFHVIQLLMKAIDDTRRDECRRVEGPARKALKKTRFALLRNPRHRRPADIEAITRVQATNRRLARAYELRVDFEELWECDDEGEAKTFIKRWTRNALLSRREPLRKFARTVREHQHGILGFFRWHGMTNAQLEGIANKIKLCMHRAYGFRSVAALMAMVKLCCSGIDLST